MRLKVAGAADALYLVFFSLLFVLFSIFLYGQLSRSLIARLDETIAAEAETAAFLFPDEFQEMKGDALQAAREVVGEMKIHGRRIVVREGSRVLAASDTTPAPAGSRVASRGATAGGRAYEIEVSAPLESVERSSPVRRVIFISLPLLLHARRHRRISAGDAGVARCRAGAADLGNNLERASRWSGRRRGRVLVTSFNELLSRLDQSLTRCGGSSPTHRTSCARPSP